MTSTEIDRAPQERATGDEAAIRSVVLDYFEGWFEGDPVRMERALHPELAKRSVKAGGFGKDESEERLESITAREMIDATAGGLGKTRLRLGEDPRIQIEIEDLYDTIANVTVRSTVYREYVHLVRTRAGWKIANAVWQRIRNGRR